MEAPALGGGEAVVGAGAAAGFQRADDERRTVAAPMLWTHRRTATTWRLFFSVLPKVTYTITNREHID